MVLVLVTHYDIEIPGTVQVRLNVFFVSVG
jgi:hypothetical protein